MRCCYFSAVGFLVFLLDALGIVVAVVLFVFLLIGVVDGALVMRALRCDVDEDTLVLSDNLLFLCFLDTMMRQMMATSAIDHSMIISVIGSSFAISQAAEKLVVIYIAIAPV